MKLRVFTWEECTDAWKSSIVGSLYDEWHERYEKYSHIFSEDDLRQFLSEQYEVFVFGDEDIPVGTVTIQNELGSPDMAIGYRVFWIGNLFVDPKYRGRGLGSTILTYAENSLKEMGVKHVGLMAEDRLTPFYRAKGYKPVGFHHLTGDTVLLKWLE